MKKSIGVRRLTIFLLGLICLANLPASAVLTAVGPVNVSTWSGPGQDFNTAGNWSAGVPADIASFSNASPQSISVVGDTSLNGLTFNGGASPYVFTVSGQLTLSGSGITNHSSNTQTIKNTNFGTTVFQSNSTADNAAIVNGGSAPNAFFFDGGVIFADNSTAGRATITNNNGGFTGFADSATAAGATITNDSNGITEFFGGASAASSTITNNSFGSTFFGETATAANATITNNSNGSTEFFGEATAGSATIVNNSGGSTLFFSNSTGGNAALINNAGGIVDISNLATSSMTAGSIAGAGSFILGTKSLTVGGNGQSTMVSGVISGAGGSLVKTGAGALTLSGFNTYTGGTILNEGTLAVAPLVPIAVAGVARPAPVLAALISPFGSGDLTVNGGTLKVAPGGFGAIPVDGNYFQNAGTLELKLGGGASTGLSDQLIVLGAANLLPGSRLRVSVAGGGYLPRDGKSLPLVIAITSMNGNFGTISGPAGLGLTFDPVTGNLHVNQKSFIPSAVTANQAAIGGYLDKFSKTATADLGTLVGNVNTIDPGLLPAALNELSPQRFEMYSDIAFRSAAFTQQELGAHLGRLRSGASGLDMAGMVPHTAGPEAMLADAAVGRSAERWDFPTGMMSRAPTLASAQGAPAYGGGSSFSVNRDLGAFVSGDATFARQDATSDQQKSNFTTAGTTAGLDYRLGDNAAAGVLFGYNHTGASLDDEGSNAGVSSYAPGLYATYFLDRFYVNGLLSYAHNSYDADRKINFAGISRTAHSTTNGNQFLANVDAGMGYKAGGWNMGPAAGLQYVKLKVNGFTESGADAADLIVADQKSDSLRSRLGGQVDRPFKAGSVVLTPQGRAAWQHEYLDKSRAITAGFDQPGLGTFSVQTTSPQRNSALLGAGLSAQLTSAVSLSLNYDAQVGQSRFFAQSIQGGGSVRF